MPVEATAVDTPFESQTADDTDARDESQTADDTDARDESQTADDPDARDKLPQSPKKKPGRPAGSKDKAPRRRPLCAQPRPVTRRSAPPRKTEKRVQIESASEASESAEEVESPRTVRHRQYVNHRQHMQDMHQASVNRYAALFDRMLA